MRLIPKRLSEKEIEELRQEYGDYLKVTVDLRKRIIVAGSELHTDGEKLLLEKNSRQNDIWGGGIHLKEKEIDATAVLNLRPNLGNSSLEILDPTRRKKFIKIIKEFFAELWG